MNKRGRFLYFESDRTVFISYENQGKGVAVDRLLPKKFRGMRFDEVSVSKEVRSFFDLADLVLASPHDWAAFGRSARAQTATKEKPAKVSPPSPDLEFLRLKLPNGDMDADRTSELFEVVRAYWKSEKDLGLQPGVAAHLWHEGSSSAAIIEFIRIHTKKDPKTGKPVLNLSEPAAGQDEQTPAAKLVMELSKGKGGEVVDPDRANKVILWLRSLKPDDAKFNEPDAIKMDFRQLGFFDDAGNLNPDRVSIGRAFLDNHWQDQPNYPKLWRHLQTQFGVMSAEAVDADYTEFDAHIAALVDAGMGNLDLASEILQVERTGMVVPTSALWQADRLQMIMTVMPERLRTSMQVSIDARDLHWFSPNNVTFVLRQLLKDQSYGSSEAEFHAWLDDNGSPSLMRQVKAVLGNKNKARNLQQLGLLDEHWQWSEVGFQQHRAILKEAQAEGREPSFEWLRWETHQRHHADNPIPFEWALLDDRLPKAAVHRARRVASIALSGGLLGEQVEVGDTLLPDQYQTLRRVGTWITDPLEYQRHEALWWLGLLARNDDINWRNLEQICSFISDKLDQTPDRKLLSDWRAGVVTFEGQGRDQMNPATPFQGADKVGRNDPCACGSGKKFKKCCGR